MSLDLTVGKFIEKERLFHDHAHLLCAVSGGIDSMVMLNLLRNRGHNIIVGHVNYMLRGGDSILDRKLVEDYCKQHSIAFHVLELSKEEVKSLESGNLQEKARNIRYDWLRELSKQEECDFICVAHHQEDVVESFFLNAIRGAGSEGLSSIKSKFEEIRRPLLSSSKKDIIEYAKRKNIPYRQDKTNEDSKYDRNFIRNVVLVQLQKRWPKATERIAKSINNLAADNALLKTLYNKEKVNWIQPCGTYQKFGPIDEFVQIQNAHTLAFHFLKDLGFDYSIINKMVFDKHTSGAVFSNSNFVCLVDRNHILIRKQKEDSSVHHKIDSPGTYNIGDHSFKFSTSSIESTINHQSEMLQLSSVQWPLTLRTWQSGDIFKPLGMKGRSKKVSDLLADLKINKFEKEDQLVLLNADEEIIWVVGRRLSESVKVTDQKDSMLNVVWNYSGNTI